MFDWCRGESGRDRIHKDDVLAVGGGDFQAPIPGRRDALIGLAMQAQASGWVLVDRALHNVGRRIGAAVVDDDVFPVFERLVLNARDCVGDERLRIVTGRYDANYGHGSAVSGYSLLQKASRLLLPSNYLTKIYVCAAFRSGAHVDVLDNAVELNLRLTNEARLRLMLRH